MADIRVLTRKELVSALNELLSLPGESWERLSRSDLEKIVGAIDLKLNEINPPIVVQAYLNKS